MMKLLFYLLSQTKQYRLNSEPELKHLNPLRIQKNSRYPLRIRLATVVDLPSQFCPELFFEIIIVIDIRSEGTNQIFYDFFKILTALQKL